MENTSFCKLLIFCPLTHLVAGLGKYWAGNDLMPWAASVDENTNSMQNANNIQQYYRVLIISGMGVIILRNPLYSSFFQDILPGNCNSASLSPNTKKTRTT